MKKKATTHPTIEKKTTAVLDPGGVYEDRNRYGAVASALAQADLAYEALRLAVNSLSVLPLPYFPAMDETQSALSAVDIARAHIRELLKRMP